MRSRRRFLHWGGASLVPVAAGCSTEADPETARRSPDMPTYGVLVAERAEEQETVELRPYTLSVSDLPAAERELARDAIADGVRFYCEPPAALRSLADRFEREEFLLADDVRYAVYLAITDQVYVSGADPPDGRPDCP